MRNLLSAACGSRWRSTPLVLPLPLPLLLLLLLVPDAQASHRREVFVVHSYSQEYPWTKRQHEGFLAGLAVDQGTRYGVRAEYLDTKRVAYDAAYALSIAEHLAAKYRGYAPDALYVTDDNALAFALDYLRGIFPAAPIVFSGVNDYGIKDRLDPARVTGVFERKEIAPNLEFVRLVAPDVTDIVVVGDASETYRAIEQEVRTELANYPGIRARFVADRRLEVVLDALKEGQERFLVLTTVGSLTNAAGEPLMLDESIPAIAALGRHAIISMEDVYLVEGVLGGYVTSGIAQGEAAARIVVHHFAGAPISTIAPVQESPNEYLLDARELQQAGLTLPAGLAGRVTILNPLPGFYERHQDDILLTLYALTALFAVSISTGLWVVLRKNRQIGANSSALRLQAAEMAEVQDSLVRAQRLAAIGNWDLHVAENRLYWSHEIYRIFGIDKSRFAASYEGFMARVHVDDRSAVEDAMRRALDNDDAYDITHRIVLQDGEIRIVREIAEVVRNASGQAVRMIGTVMDVTERKQSEDRLAHLANYDPVTGLPNRFLFGDRLTHAMHSADRLHKRAALLFIDLDNFKHINDTLGHASGDEVLRQVASRLGAVLRSTDTVSRLGGDEFTVILENLDHDDEAVRVAACILEQSGRPFVLGSREVYVTSSVGIAIYPQDGDSVEALLMNADAAMYRAKENGRHGFEFFTKEINARAQERMDLGNELRGALARGEFSLHYQPKVVIADGAVIGFEALLRWRNVRLGDVSPAVFIPILEEIGLIVDVGEWVLREACRWAAGLRVASGPAPGVSVNLSARQFRLPHLDQVVHSALVESGLPACRLELEITESSLVNLETNLQVMDRLKGLGVGLSIDDFGTGYSSLSYLKRFPVDRLKIDASFVRDVAIDPDDAVIAIAIIGLAHHLQLRVIAEGVETLAQMDFLRSHGCDEAQGYLLARPMPDDRALDWLHGLQPGAAVESPRLLVGNG